MPAIYNSVIQLPKRMVTFISYSEKQYLNIKRTGADRELWQYLRSLRILVADHP
jgi:hypothetical protein